MRAVRSAKLFEIELDAKDAPTARAAVEEMCRKLLANPVIHDYGIRVEGEPGRSPAAARSGPRPRRHSSKKK